MPIAVRLFAGHSVARNGGLLELMGNFFQAPEASAKNGDADLNRKIDLVHSEAMTGLGSGGSGGSSQPDFAF
jgi:hypothetical protein